jgi:hypothetical protein
MQSQLSTSTTMSHERAQQAIQDQALLEGRIVNAKSPCGPVLTIGSSGAVSAAGG